MDVLIQDLRYAARQLRHSPLFTLTAVLSLAVGIGAATAVYSVVHAVLLAPVEGLRDPGRLVEVGRTEGGSGFDTFGYQDYLDLARGSRALSGLYGWEPRRVDQRPEGGEAAKAFAFGVTANYFDVLGVQPELGRLLQPEDDSPAGGAAVVVASHDFFTRVLRGDPLAIGRPIVLSGAPFTLVGVAAPGFHSQLFGLAPDLFVPMTTPLGRENLSEVLTRRGAAWMLLGGRLADGRTVGEARAEMAALFSRIKTEFPDAYGEWGTEVVPAGPSPAFARTPLSLFAALLFALVLLVLLIACANVSSMLLARAEPRARELAIRLALGARRGRLLGQLLLESLLLFALAAPVGCLFAWWGTRLLGTVAPPTPFPLRTAIPMAIPVLLFAAGLALVTGILFGLAPALQGARQDPWPVLRGTSAGGGAPRWRLRSVLVGGQVALSLVLLVAAGLLGRSLSRAASLDLGFEPEGVAAFEFDFSSAGYDQARGAAVLASLLERFASDPEVAAAASARVLPLEMTSLGLGGIAVPGQEAPEGGFRADTNVVSPGYFATLGIPLRGREFLAQDAAGAPGVAVVNEAFAARFFPGRDALGESFVLNGPDSGQRTPLRVVGVARNGKYRSLGEATTPFFWVPVTQIHLPTGHILLRARGGRAADLTRAVAAVFHAVDPNLPAPLAVRLTDVAATSILPQRIAGGVAGSLGLVGLALAALGLHGVVAHAVTRRKRELALRIVFGARAAQLVGLVVRQTAVPVLWGTAIGLPAALAGAWAARGLLFGVPPADPAALGLALGVLALAALAAAWVPARRAAAIAPAESLRQE